MFKKKNKEIKPVETVTQPPKEVQDSKPQKLSTIESEEDQTGKTKVKVFDEDICSIEDSFEKELKEIIDKHEQHGADPDLINMILDNTKLSRQLYNILEK